MAQRQDGWANLITGLGSAMRDKRLASELMADYLAQPQAELLWRSDDMAARIVEKIPDDAMRRGFNFHLPSKSKKKQEQPPDQDDPIFGPVSDPGYTPTMLEQRNPQTDGPPSNLNRKDAAIMAAGLSNMSGARSRTPLPSDPTLATTNSDDDEQAKEQEKAVMDRHKTLGTRHAIREAAKFERAYGGAAIFMGTVDRSPGKSPNILTRPLDLTVIDSLRFLTVLTPSELVPFRYYGNPLAPNYGKVQIWTMVPRSKGVNPNSSLQRVHESRLVVFPGIRTSRFMRESMVGWGDSFLNRCVQHIRNFSMSYDSAAVLTQDFAQAVWKMKNLVETLQADDKDLVQRRATAMDMSRSVLRAMVIDQDEEFTRTVTPVTGLPDLLDRMAERLCAAATMPFAQLMGRAPAGLNATGQGDRDWYNDVVANLQQDRVLPALERITQVELNAKEGATKGIEPENWSVSLPDLEEPSEVEQASIRLQTSQADALDIDRGVLMPEEVAQSHFGGDRYQVTVKLNQEIREAAMAMKQQADDKQEADAQAQLDAVAKGSQQLGLPGVPQQKPKPPKKAGGKPPPKKG